MHWLGLDIGGANLKLADGHGYAASRQFPLWQRPAELAEALASAIALAPACDRLAVTMTGELADCFPNKDTGVQRILEAVQEAAAGRPIHVYAMPGEFLTTSQANARTADVAAANWHGLGRFSGRFASVAALLVDIGSTTCDVIPLSAGAPSTCGHNDTERLMNGELVYCGVTRTPVCGLVTHISWRGTPCPVAREWFATTRDVYTLTGDLPEDPEDTETADGQPATSSAAHTRLARMVCADPDAFSLDDALVAAREIANVQADLIAAAMRQVMARTEAPPTTVIVSGGGEFLARRAVARLGGELQIISLRDTLGAEVSACAPAHAVAVLAAEELRP